MSWFARGAGQGVRWGILGSIAALVGLGFTLGVPDLQSGCGGSLIEGEAAYEGDEHTAVGVQAITIGSALDCTTSITYQKIVGSTDCTFTRQTTGDALCKRADGTQTVTTADACCTAAGPCNTSWAWRIVNTASGN